MTSDLLIRNAILVNEGREFESDLLVRDGRIHRIDRDIAAPDGATIIDADGKHLLPGVVDDQVHFREPGLTHKGNIFTESRAAIAGGVTSFMDMPNTRPPTVTHAALDAKYASARQNAAANYGFYFGATNDNIEEIRSLDPSSTCGVKVFMGSSTGNMLVDDDDILARIFEESPVPIATHCESTPRINANIARAQEKYGDNIPVTEHANIRDVDACYMSTEKAVGLARRFGTQLHVLHVSSAKELDLFTPGPLADKHITAETCIHFLHFTDADYAAYGNRIKCNPSVKAASDRDTLIAALTDGRIDIIATDHAPHTIEEKASTDYLKAPAGLPLVQDLLLASLELSHTGQVALPVIINAACHNPATRFGVQKRGYLREGYWADLVLVDMHKPTLVSADNVLSRCGWSPFEGRTFSSHIVSTWVNGVQAYDGQNVIEHGAAHRLEFNHERNSR